MQELLWEIWMGKRNTHHRAQVDLNDNPHGAFLRIARELRGTDKEIALSRRDPNTGQTTEVKWKYSWRSEGKEIPLKSHTAFSAQGVTPDALIVVREVEMRANTIYIDGFEGLAQEEMAAARSKTPLIVGLLLFLLLAGGLGYYFLVALPAEKARAPYRISVSTQPAGAKLLIWLDVSKVPKSAPPGPRIAKKAAKKSAPADGEREQKLKSLAVETPVKNLPIPKKAQVIFISISKKGYLTWKTGTPLKQWNKDQAGLRKIVPMDPKELTVKGFFPKDLKKQVAPVIPTVPAPAPKALQVAYPRRWRRFKLGLDPRHGGVNKQGVKGISGKTAGDLNLAITKAILAELKSKRRKYRVYASRTKDDITDDATRVKRLKRKRVRAIVQFDFHSGVKELPKASKTLKKDQKLVPYNDSVSGFLVYYSTQNKRADKSKKLADCVGTAMKQAGFKPRGARKGEPATVAALGVRSMAAKDPILNGKTPAVRLIPGYLSHRGADKVFNQPATHKIISQVVESALICFKKR